jgi:hypothetical protein
MKQSAEEMNELLRLEIEAWQNPVFETILGPISQNIVDSAIEETEEELKLQETLLLLPNETNLTETNDTRFTQPDVPHVD